MSFTNRFITVPIIVYSQKEMELTGNATERESYYKFLPFELASYRPTFAIDEDIEVTKIILKNGETTIVELSVKEFENLINKFVGE